MKALMAAGYPDGLKGEEIPYNVSLIKVADVYDALSRKRQYKESYTQTYTIRLMIDDVKKNRLCAQFLYFLVSALIKELDKKIIPAYDSMGILKNELETLHELETIYKEIYDRGYTPKLQKKLERYNLSPGYDMSTNAQLLIYKQRVYENENKNYEFLTNERKIMSEQLKELKELYRKEKWYK